MAGAILKALDRFHHWEARQITGMTATRGVGRKWEYPPVVAELESAGLHPIMEYIRKWQATISEKVTCCPIYELCVEAERRLGTSRRMRWWDQDVINEPEE